MDLEYDSCELADESNKVKHDREDLENIKKDSDQMPLCSEKIILKLIYYSSTIKLGTKQPLDLDLEKEINLLNDRLRREELLSEKIERDFQDLKTYLLKYSDFKSAVESLYSILSNIRDINVQELIRLTESNDQAIELIKNKNIHLIIGLTGTGKSTTLHFLGGSKMENVTKNGQPHIEAVEIKNKYLKKVKSSASIMSETRNIIPVLIEADTNLGLNESTLIFCDSPGFEDTNGPEIDISNSIAIQRSIEVCGGIKPIVVTSSKAGDRFERLAILTQILSGMFNNFEQNLIHFAYVFTKFTTEERFSVRNTLINIRDDLNKKQTKGEEIDKSFKLVIQDMIKKSTLKGTNNKNYVVLDPINDDPNDIISLLVDETYIQNPSRELKTNFSFQSKLKLEKQIDKHFKLIEVALLSNEKELALFKLNELIHLRDVIKQDDFIEKFEDVFNNLVKSLNKDNDSTITRFNRKLERNDELNGDDYVEYIKCLLNSNLTQKIINKVNSTKLNKYQEFVDNINFQMTKLNQKLKTVSLEEEPESAKRILDNLKILVRIWKFNLSDILKNEISHNENEVSAIYKNSCDLLETKVNYFMKEIFSIIYTSDFDKISKYLSKIELYGKLFEDHVSNISKLYDEAKQELIKNFEKIVNESEEIIRKQKQVNEINIKTLNENEFYISKATRFSILHFHISLDTIESYNNKFLDLVYEFSKSLIDRIILNIQEINIDKRSNIDSLELIKSSFNQLKLIIDNDQFYKTINKIYNEALDSLVTLVYKLKSGLENQVQYFLNSSDNMENSVYKFVQKITLLTKLSWIDEFRENVYNFAFRDIGENLLTFIEQIKFKLNSQKVTLEKYADLSTINEGICKVVGLEPCASIFPELKEPIESVKDRFKDELERELDKVIRMYSDQNSSIDDFHHIDDNCNASIKFLDECENIIIKKSSIISKHSLAKKLLKDFIQKRLRFLKEKIESSLESIKEDRIDNLRVLVEKMNEINGVKNFPSILNHIPDFKPKDYMDEIKVQLGEIHSNFESKINDLITIGNNNELINKLDILKKLRKLDDFSNENFFELYKRYATRAREDRITTFNNCKILIDKNKFQELYEELCRLNKQDMFYESLIEKLRNKLIDLSKEAINQSKKFDELKKENLETLNHYIQLIEDAKQLINEHLDQATIDQLNSNEKIIKESVQNLFEGYLKTIEDSEKNFSIDDKASKLILLKPLLINFIDNKALEKLNNLDISDLIMNSIKKFKDYKIEDYVYHSPKEAYEKLSSNENAKIAFKKLIRESYVERLNEAKNMKELSIDNNDHFRKCKRSLNTLPDDIKSDIENLLNDVEEEINKILMEKELNMFLNMDDFKSIALRYYDSFIKGEKNTMKKIKSFIFEKNIQFSKDLNQSYEKSDLKIFYEIFEKLLALDECFSKYFGFIKTNLQENVEKLRNIFFDSIKKFYEVIRNKGSNLQQKDSLVQSFENVLKIVDIDNRNQDKRLFNNNPHSLFKDCFDALITKIQESIVDNQKNFPVDLLDLNIDNLEITLNLTIIFEPLISKKEYIFLQSTQEIESYDTLKMKILEQIKSFLNDLMNIKFLSISNESKVQKDFDKFFDDLNTKLEKVSKIKHRLKSHFSNENFAKYEEDIFSVMTSNANQFSANCINLFDPILNLNYTKKDVDDFYSSYYNLSSINKKFGPRLKKVQTKSEIDNKLEAGFKNKIESLIINLKNEDIQKVTEILIHIKSYSNVLFIYKDKIDKELDKIILSYIENNGGFETIGKLALLLKENLNGSMILSEHKVFESYNRSIFNRKTQSQNITYVLENLKGTKLDTRELKKLYQEFEVCFEDLIHNYMRPKIDYQKFIGNMNILIGKMRSPNFQWDNHVKRNLPSLIAHIFALWALLNSTNYFEKKSDQKSFLFIPHPAQVVAIFRILGLGYNVNASERVKNFLGNFVSIDETLRKNLVQLGTGEGKSVILAVCAVALSLLGLEVFCVCYSDYLSNRDYKAFKELFDRLKVTSKIHYGTFNKICENRINERGDIRKMVENIIFEQSFHAKNKTNENPKILLIDEIDVFFSKDFYGSSYKPSLELKHISIKNFINFVWSNKSDINFKTATESDEFKELINNFPNWKELFVETVKDILIELENFEKHEYVVQDDKIGYKEQDSIVFDTSYGYKTIFAYFKENESKKISDSSLNENTNIFIKLGSFSYAEMPNNNFFSILGITGTLKHLSEPEKDIITKTYDINEQTFIPSVYGGKNIKFKPKDDLLIEKSHNHYSIIVQEINYRMEGKTEGTKRAVFVFFESKHELFKFYNSNEFVPYKMDTLVLTEEANLDEKNNIIKNSTASGKITLFTRIFGRGTDFVVHDNKVSANGGIHVIQTFLSEEYSEEIQIQGRTARQGESGSYSLIISESALEKYSISKEDLNANSQDIYSFLNQKRNEFFAKQYVENSKCVNLIEDKHKHSMAFLNNLFNGKIFEAKKFILEENKGAELSGDSKTIILMDATGSMYMLLEKTKRTLETMFERVSKILQENGYSESFQIKIVVYRNYNSPDDQLLQSSSWESKPQNLITFLKTVNCAYGMGNEAVEMGLWLANQEKYLSQIILIGDAPANTKEEIDIRRSQYPSKVYKDINTFYENEINVLKSKNIPVHAFYLENRAKENFKVIAKTTGGQCAELKIDTDQGSNDLTNLVNIELLRNIGGSVKGNELVSAYKTKYNTF